MNLDFLAVSAEGAVARSPMEHSAAQEGATFEVRDGWNIAVAFPGESAQVVGWADSSHLRKLELQGTAEDLDATDNLRLGDAVRVDDAWWCRLTATRALVIGGNEPVAGAVDITSNLAALTLVGPMAPEVFARFSAIDLRPKVTPVGALRPGSIARQPGILIREAEDRFLMLFGWATGEYVWSVVADAGFHLGGRPIGADALAALPGSPSEREAARA